MILIPYVQGKTPSTLQQSEDIEESADKAQILARRKEMLQAHDRDNEDLDLGFGSSRFEDQEEGEESSFKFSKWTDNGDGQGGKDHGDKSKRKRGPKKKKGDKNNMADVMKVIAGRKG